MVRSGALVALNHPGDKHIQAMTILLRRIVLPAVVCMPLARLLESSFPILRARHVRISDLK